MEEKNDMDKVDDVMLPGFRFHPTDEELVGFYLKRKVQQQPLPIELIKQVDIYKYDPWDLPKLATTGEKEWYFYCPRDRKYRNSARPNRVTGAGFWKATGTDRPIYSSDGTKCIGLKKSLVFYRGRAAKGFKTDWMMHEFRLPSSSSSFMSNSLPPKKPLDKSFPAYDSWAICRIFKKTNSMAQRALSHSWVSPLPEISASEMFSHGAQCSEFSPDNISCTTEIASVLQFCSNNSTDLQQQQTCTANFSAQNLSPYTKPTLFPFSNGEIPSGFMFSPLEVSGTTKSSVDGGSMTLSPAMISSVSTNNTNNASESVVEFDGSNNHFTYFSMNLPHDVQANMEKNLGSSQANTNQWGPIRSLGFPFNLPGNDQPWKPNLPWDSPPCPSDMSTSFSTNKCYN